MNFYRQARDHTWMVWELLTLIIIFLVSCSNGWHIVCVQLNCSRYTITYMLLLFITEVVLYTLVTVIILFQRLSLFNTIGSKWASNKYQQPICKHGIPINSYWLCYLKKKVTCSPPSWGSLYTSIINFY